MYNLKGIDKTTLLWFNSEIRIDNKPCFYLKAAKRGLLTLNDMLNEDGKICDYQEICRKYPECMTWLQYRSLLAALPKQWGNVPSIKAYEMLKDRQDKVKKMYEILINQSRQSLTEALNKLGHLFMVTEPEIEDVFLAIKKVTNITKYRDFQYRLLNSAIFTNNRLFYWKKVPSQKCDYCKETIQTIDHLLFNCRQARKVWKELHEFYRQLYRN